VTTSTTAGVAERAALSRALFAPDSIALIGASGDETKYTSLPQRYLRKHGFAGAIFPVNPSRTEIFGERAYASIDRVPQRVDHAFIMLTAKMVPGAVEQCASNGVRCATIFSGGFAEAGDAGRKLQIATVEAAQRSGMRLLGPNCLGVINANDKVALSANEALEASQLVGGRISLLSQSGSLLGSLLSRAQDRGLRLAKMVSVGNEADLSVGELGELLVDDPHTDAILLFLETIRDADRFSAMARRAFAVGKPLIAYLLGRSAVGNQLAASHTGAIAGNSAAIDAFLCDNGVIRVDMIEALIEMPPLVIGRRPPDRRRINVMTTAGAARDLQERRVRLRPVASADIAAAVEGLRFPVALKIVSPDIAHKTEAGGVSLGIASAQALAGEIEKMLETVRQRQAQAKLAGFSVQEMHRGLAEVLVGYRLDPQVGPTIAVGVGGVLAEIYRDITVAMAPVTVEAARDMIEKVRGLAPIRGYRNLPRGDLDALARAIAVWSTLAMLPGSNITGAELNPLVVGPEGQGVVAVDALLIRTERKAS
jgi:acyl-CoA synthetase (NDP forming)